MAVRNKRAVYTVQQLANVIGKSKNITKVYMQRLVQKGLATRLIRGKISFIDDDALIASQLVEPAYISLISALSFHKLIKQVPKNTECITTKNSLQYKNLGITYHKIPPTLFFGYEKYSKNGSYIFVATPEKALIDSVYLNLISKSTCKEILEKVDKKNMESYLSRFKGKGKKKLREWLI